MKRSDPVAEILPSVADKSSVSALNKARLAVATPLEKLILVATPTLVPATVGLVAGLIEAFAPEKVIDLVPV
ncbi:hypothetical protein AQBE111736_13815 [Aquirufa beregesia]